MKMKTLSSVKTGRRGDTDQTHRAGGHGEPAKNYRASKGELPYIGVVHRLDQPVEGIMVFAKIKKQRQI